MRYVFLVVSGLMLSLAAASAADTPPFVRDFLAQQASQCRSAGGVPVKFEAAATAVDINGDGTADWVIDFSKAQCEGAAGYFCGLAGCQIYVLMAQGANYLHAWGDAVYVWRQVRVGDKPGLQVEMHGSACGHFGAGECTKSLVFDGIRLREVK